MGAAVASCSGSEEPLVATAEGYRLTVDETVSLFAAAPQLPARTEVVDAFADLWVNYTLLAEAVTRDSTLRNLELDPLLETELERERILELVDDPPAATRLCEQGRTRIAALWEAEPYAQLVDLLQEVA